MARVRPRHLTRPGRLIAAMSVEPLAVCYPWSGWRQFRPPDSEQFRSAPRTCRHSTI